MPSGRDMSVRVRCVLCASAKGKGNSRRRNGEVLTFVCLRRDPRSALRELKILWCLVLCLHGVGKWFSEAWKLQNAVMIRMEKRLVGFLVCFVSLSGKLGLWWLCSQTCGVVWGEWMWVVFPSVCAALEWKTQLPGNLGSRGPYQLSLCRACCARVSGFSWNTSFSTGSSRTLIRSVNLKNQLSSEIPVLPWLLILYHQ